MALTLDELGKTGKLPGDLGSWDRRKGRAGKWERVRKWNSWSSNYEPRKKNTPNQKKKKKSNRKRGIHTNT